MQEQDIRFTLTNQETTHAQTCQTPTKESILLPISCIFNTCSQATSKKNNRNHRFL